MDNVAGSESRHGPHGSREGARRDLARRGYDPVFGARPLGRLIESEVGNLLADEILFGCLTGGGKVRIGCKSGQLDFKFY